MFKISSLFFSCWPNFLDVLAGNFFGTWQHCTQLGFAVPARPAGILSSQEHHQHNLAVPARLAGLQSVLSSLTQYRCDRQLGGTVYAGLIETKWRISVVSECC